MNDLSGQQMLRDDDGAVETVYVPSSVRTVEDGWLVTSLDVGSWRPLKPGDMLLALDRSSPAEFVVEVTDVEVDTGEVFYRLRHVADLHPTNKPLP